VDDDDGRVMRSKVTSLGLLLLLLLAL